MKCNGIVFIYLLHNSFLFYIYTLNIWIQRLLKCGHQYKLYELDELVKMIILCDNETRKYSMAIASQLSKADAGKYLYIWTYRCNWTLNSVSVVKIEYIFEFLDLWCLKYIIWITEMQFCWFWTICLCLPFILYPGE